MSKRIISLLIALTLILCLGACSKAPAAPAITGSGTADDPWTIGATADDDITAYLTEDYQLEINGTGAMMDFNSPDDTPWADSMSKITAINVWDARSIGANAFKGAGADNENYIDFFLPTEKLDEIGDSAFENAKLGTGDFCCITINSDIKRVGSRAFANVGLTEVQAYCSPENIEADAFANNSGKFYATALTGYNWDDSSFDKFEGDFEPHYLFAVKYKEQFNTDEISNSEGVMNVPDDQPFEYDASVLYEEEGFKFAKYEIVTGNLDIDATNPVINTELTGNIEMFVYYEK